MSGYPEIVDLGDGVTVTYYTEGEERTGNGELHVPLDVVRTWFASEGHEGPVVSVRSPGEAHLRGTQGVAACADHGGDSRQARSSEG